MSKGITNTDLTVNDVMDAVSDNRTFIIRCPANIFAYNLTPKEKAFESKETNSIGKRTTLSGQAIPEGVSSTKHDRAFSFYAHPNTYKNN